MLKIAYNLLFHPQLFRPTYMINHVSDLVQLQQKYQLNYLVLDKDDTLVPVYQYQIKDQRISQTLDQLQNKGVVISIVSNSVIVDEKDQPKKPRVHNIDLFLAVKKKPFNGTQIQDFIRIRKTVDPAVPQFTKQKIAVVGDRLFTDVHLGNLMGWKSFLVKPIEKTTIKKHGIGVYLMRHIQNFYISRFNYKQFQPSKVNKNQSSKQ